MTSKVKELVEAAKRAQVLLRAVTVRRVLEAGSDVIEASGLNPWCVNEGRADGSESIGTWWLESAISAVESEGDGWIKIKDGCEMPAEGADILFNIPWCYGVEKGRYFSGRWISDRTSPYGDQISFDVEEATHWQPLPAPPTKEGR